MEQAIYTAYGDTARGNARRRTAYAGEAREAGTGWYALGQRFYDPQFRRFHEADPYSPFDDGGLNRYAYCAGDPIDRIDPQGNEWWSWLRSKFMSQRGPKAGGGASGDLLPSMLTPTTAEAGAPVSGLTSVRDAASARTSHAEGLPHVLGMVSARVTPGPAEKRGAPDIGRYRNTGNGGTLGQLISRPGPTSRPEVTVIAHPGRRKVRVLTQGYKFIEPEWHERPFPSGNRARAAHWLADAETVPSHIEAPLHRISQKHAGARPDVYVYMGVHGAPTGDNWESGVRQFPAAWDHEGYGQERLQAQYPDLNIALDDIAGITRGAMKKKIRRAGEHVHAYCFSGVDTFVTRQLKIGPLPIYRLP